ncbi:MAG: hypothetical protein ACK5LC_14675 [Coprobacillaceae bacterium]
MSVLFGTIVNIVLYDILGNITIDSYAMQIVILILGQAIMAFAVGCVMVINMVTFPVEGACMAISEKFNKKFHIVRQLVDVIAVLITLVLVFILNEPLVVREGTIIGVLMFGPLMGIFMKLMTPPFKKMKLMYIEKD